VGCGWGTSRQAGDAERGFRLAQSVGVATREVDLLKGSECSLYGTYFPLQNREKNQTIWWSKFKERLYCREDESKGDRDKDKSVILLSSDIKKGKRVKTRGKRATSLASTASI